MTIKQAIRTEALVDDLVYRLPHGQGYAVKGIMCTFTNRQAAEIAARGFIEDRPVADNPQFDQALAAAYPSTDDQRASITAPGPENTAAGGAMRKTYRKLTEQEQALMGRVKDLGEEFVHLLHEIGGTDASGEKFASRNLSISFTAIEDAVSRAVKHITK